MTADRLAFSSGACQATLSAFITIKLKTCKVNSRKQKAYTLLATSDEAHDQQEMSEMKEGEGQRQALLILRTQPPGNV
jgi:hypothetical protein